MFVMIPWRERFVVNVNPFTSTDKAAVNAKPRDTVPGTVALVKLFDSALLKVDQVSVQSHRRDSHGAWTRDFCYEKRTDRFWTRSGRKSRDGFPSETHQWTLELAYSWQQPRRNRLIQRTASGPWEHETSSQPSPIPRLSSDA